MFYTPAAAVTGKKTCTIRAESPKMAKPIMNLIKFFCASWLPCIYWIKIRKPPTTAKTPTAAFSDVLTHLLKQDA